MSPIAATARRTQEPPPVAVPFQRRRTEWIVPLEMVLFQTSSVLKKVVLDRCEKGDRPDRDVRVFDNGGRLFAEIQFTQKVANEKRWLLLPLDCWPLSV